MIGTRSWSRPTARGLVLVLALLLLALDWLALDDITTGTEPSHAFEWAMVIASLPLMALCALAVRRLTANAAGL